LQTENEGAMMHSCLVMKMLFVGEFQMTIL